MITNECNQNCNRRYRFWLIQWFFAILALLLASYKEIQVAQYIVLRIHIYAKCFRWNHRLNLPHSLPFPLAMMYLPSFGIQPFTTRILSSLLFFYIEFMRINREFIWGFLQIIQGLKKRFSIHQNYIMIGIEIFWLIFFLFAKIFETVWFCKQKKMSISSKVCGTVDTTRYIFVFKFIPFKILLFVSWALFHICGNSGNIFGLFLILRC